MRENYRNSIASVKKFPQFTTMNVIEGYVSAINIEIGQAGIVAIFSLIFYCITLDNILNIIVLLILWEASHNINYGKLKVMGS